MKNAQDKPRDPALELLGDLRQPVVLDAAARRRIWQKVEGSAAGLNRSPGLWFFGFAAGAAAVVALILLARKPTDGPPLASHHQDVVVPACNVTRLTDDARHYRATFVGPSSIRIEEGVMRMASGRVLLATTEAAATVLTRDARVLVQARSFVEIVWREHQTLKVAAYRGSAEVAWLASGNKTLVAAGNGLDDGVVGSVNERDAATARKLSESDQAALDLCAAHPSAPTPAPVIAEPPPRPPARRLPAPSPAIVEPPQAPPPPRPVQDATRLAAAIERLRNDHDARGALALLDDLDHQATHHGFSQEVSLVRLEALQALGDSTGALRILDGLRLPDVPRGHDLQLVRADLRAKAGRCREALDDYGALISHGRDVENALVHRAACHFQLREEAAARSDLESYLAQFPNGYHAAEAKRTLGRP